MAPYFRTLFFALLILITGLLSGTSGICGNREMVEVQVKELERLNKQVVGQLPELPPDSTIKVKADIISRPEGDTVRLIEKEVIPNEKEVDSNESETTND